MCELAVEAIRPLLRRETRAALEWVFAVDEPVAAADDPPAGADDPPAGADDPPAGVEDPPAEPVAQPEATPVAPSARAASTIGVPLPRRTRRASQAARRP